MTVTGIDLDRDGRPDVLQQPRVGYQCPCRTELQSRRSVLPDESGKRGLVGNSHPSIFAALEAADPRG